MGLTAICWAGTKYPFTGAMAIAFEPPEEPAEPVPDLFVGAATGPVSSSEDPPL